MGKETKSQNQLEVLDVAWDETAGVDALDDLLVAHFAAEFKAAQGAAGDIAAAPRALAKLRKEVVQCSLKAAALSLAATHLAIPATGSSSHCQCIVCPPAPPPRPQQV